VSPDLGADQRRCRIHPGPAPIDGSRVLAYVAEAAPIDRTDAPRKRLAGPLAGEQQSGGGEGMVGISAVLINR